MRGAIGETDIQFAMRARIGDGIIEHKCFYNNIIIIINIGVYMSIL